MNILAIDCASESCSVALSIDQNVSQRIQIAPTQQHSQLLLPMQAEVLQEAGLKLSEIDCIACGTGPGSFTGVRIATALCQGLAYGASVPTLGISTLAAMAWGVCRATGHAQALVALDARMGELYWAHYASDEQGLSILHPDSLSQPRAIGISDLQDCVAVGNGWRQYPVELTGLSNGCERVEADYLIHAAEIASLAEWMLIHGQASAAAAETLQPVYLRNNVTG